MTWSYGDWHEDMVALYDDSTDAVVCWLQKKGGVDPQHLPLIKAAPELLERLKSMVSGAECECDTADEEHPLCDICWSRQVIAKAEGRADETTPD